MSDISTEAETDIPDFPMTRSSGRPFALPPESLALHTIKQLSQPPPKQDTFAYGVYELPVTC
jgi:hypothetical protein